MYFIPFIGFAKALGVIAILIPGFPRIKEWAYAGLIFDLIGAMVSVACTAGFASALPILVFIAFGAAAYGFHLKKLNLASTAG